MSLKKLKTELAEASDHDFREEIRVPRFLGAHLAEDIGIHIGDGSMGVYDRYDYQLQYGGNPQNEREYYDYRVSPLKRRLFNKEVNSRLLSSGIYGFKFKSKKILTFYDRVIGLPVGPKDEIGLPKLVKKSNEEIIKNCLTHIVSEFLEKSF